MEDDLEPHVSVLVPKHVSDARHLGPGHLRVLRLPVRPDAAAGFRDDFNEAFPGLEPDRLSSPSWRWRRRLQDEVLLDLLEAVVAKDVAQLLHRFLDVVQLDRSPLLGHQKTRTA